MIVDAHMHLWRRLLGSDGYPADVLRGKMEAEGVTADEIIADVVAAIPRQ